MLRNKPFLVIALSLVLAASASASTFVAMDHTDLAMQSDLIVVGRVAETHSYWNEDGTELFTEARIEVEEALFGEAPASLTLRTSGGELDGYKVTVEGAPRFQQDERFLAFLRVQESGAQVVGYSQGYYRVAEVDGQEMAVPTVDVNETLVSPHGEPAFRPSAVVLADLKDEIRALAGDLRRPDLGSTKAGLNTCDGTPSLILRSSDATCTGSCLALRTFCSMEDENAAAEEHGGDALTLKSHYYYITSYGTTTLFNQDQHSHTYAKASTTVNISGIDVSKPKLTGSGHNGDDYNYVRVMDVEINGNVYRVDSWISANATDSFTYYPPSSAFHSGENSVKAYITWGDESYCGTTTGPNGAHWVTLNLTFSAPYCGDGICNGSETSGNCCNDCGGCGSSCSKYCTGKLDGASCWTDCSGECYGGVCYF